MRTLLFLLACLIASASASASASAATAAARRKPLSQPLPKAYQYRIYLADKLSSPYSLAHPEAFLSPKSLERRRRQGLAPDSTDLPVSPYYIRQLQTAGLKIMGTSRWHNTVWVESPTDDVAGRAGTMPFVRRVLRLYAAPDSMPAPERDSVSLTLATDTMPPSHYGMAQLQTTMLGGDKLHDAGFRGEGMTIAILDAGFHNADKIPALANTRIVARRDFAPRRTTDIHAEHYHGTMVLSTMAMDSAGVMVGTAPRASFALIRTEDTATETRAEEDAWTMGVEFADSIGADLINSSLGYYHWDGDTIGPRLRDLDGRTTFVSQTAARLAAKGIILCNSAGNEGWAAWHKISVPADAPGILTVGAVDQDSTIAPFSSLGPSHDGRVKPDVCAPGAGVWVVNGRGELATNSGTSFAAPILCGLVACLWQAYPGKTASQVMEMVRQAADRRQWPDNVYGYGIPNFGKLVP